MSAYQNASDFFREFEGDPEYERERVIACTQVMIAFNVYRVRRQKGLTQAELAARAGMRQPRIAEIERGEYDLRLDTLAKIAWGLGVPVEELTRETGGRPAPQANVAPVESVVGGG